MREGPCGKRRGKIQEEIGGGEGVHGTGLVRAAAAERSRLLVRASGQSRGQQELELEAVSVSEHKPHHGSCSPAISETLQPRPKRKHRRSQRSDPAMAPKNDQILSLLVRFRSIFSYSTTPVAIPPGLCVSP